MYTYADRASSAKDKLMRKSTSAFVGYDANMGRKNPPKITFTHKSAIDKKFVPGVGKYQP